MRNIQFSSTVFAVFLLVSLSSKVANAQSNGDEALRDIIQAYYKVYKTRNDFERFLSFYDESIVLQDMISGARIIGKKALSTFFDWNNPDFQLLGTESLVIENQILEERQIVTSGHFTSFKWGEHIFGPMYFTTILTLNKKGKITRHVDWINYPSDLINYEKRKNSNAWIGKEN